ncbi:MAG: septum formation initiator family protein [Deltaproteobacteria bacterium]|nr:septum formation initiator family protein [Deltaproteobacteria bacterium]
MSRREQIVIGLIVALTVAFLALALFGRQGLREVRRLRAERQQLASEIAQLRDRRRELEAEIADLRGNTKSLEARARHDLGMIKKGETVFLLPEHHAQRR